MSSRFAEDPLVDDLGPVPPDDKEMALAFQRGEKGAYQLIYDQYEERVNRVCRRMMGTREDAQEAAQDTFLRVYTALGKFNGRYQLGAWITRIATNVCLDHIRARSRRPVDATPIEELELDFLASGADADPEAVVVRNAEGRRVRKVLLGLPPLHRAAIVLRDFEGLSYAEVAVALGMTELQVKALIHRARKGFRRSWTPLVEMLVPTRLLQKMRDVDVSVKEHVVGTAASQSAPLVSVCSGVLQQCGSFVVQKVGPVAATFVLGGAAIASPGSAPVPRPGPTAAPAAEASATPGAGSRAEAVVPRDTDVPATVTPATAESEETASPTPSSSPAESPVPTASPTASPSASPPPPSGTAVAPKTTTQTPAPAPFRPVFYFDTGHSPTPREPSSNATTVSCSTRSVDQTLRATISDHEGSYPIDLRLKAASTLQVEFTVHKKGFAVYYSGGGALTSQSNSGNQLVLTFNGRYGSGGTAADSAGLPANGSIRVELALDCTAQSLVTEGVVLTTQ